MAQPDREHERTTAAARAHILSWDVREQPDLTALAEIVHDLSGGRVHLRPVEDTGSQDCALVVASVPVDDATAQRLYLRWLREEKDDGDQVDVEDLVVPHPGREA